MRPDHRTLVALVVVDVVAGALISAALLYPVVASYTVLPVPAGAVLTDSEIGTWLVHFSVGPAGGHLVGAWTEYQGTGPVQLVVVNGTVSKPSPPPGIYHCPAEMVFFQANGSVGRVLGPGAYTMYWGTFCAYASQIVVTQTIQVLPS